VNAAAVARVVVSTIDVGAYELASGTTSVPTPPPSASSPTPPPSASSPAPSASSPPPPPPATGSTLSLLPTADAYVEANDAATTNFGASPSLFASTNTTPWYNDDSYLKFDVSTAGAITSATLKVTAALTSTADGALTLSVYPVSDTTWTEAAITWNSKPARSASPLASTSVTRDSYAVYTLDVTTYVAAQKAAGHPVVSFALHDPSAANARVLMQSKEGGTAPTLVVGE
jgi:hypothetical protein